MTEQELEQLRNRTYADVQDENGIDITLIDQLLAMTPTERLRTLEEFLEDIEVFDEARKKYEAEIARIGGKASRGGS